MERESDEKENKIKVTILYEDEQVAVINKPAGLVMHADGKTNEPALTEWVVAQYPLAAGVGEPLTLNDGSVIDRPGIVHRLDRETSGVMVVAKTQDAFLHLKAQFHDRLVEKEYWAIVWGEMKEEEGDIDRPIGRSAKDFRLRSAQRGARGFVRDAHTSYRVFKRTKEYSFVAANPKTGRTHQIRVHFKAVNHPVVCDRLYAPKQGCALGFDRLALHARSLTVTLPSGKRASFEAQLPDDFAQALSALGWL